eukprot:818058_1
MCKHDSTKNIQNGAMNSPQIQAAPIQPPPNPTNQYQANITATALTAPNNLQSGGIPTFPMSPGGSIGLTPANMGGNTPQQQIMNTNVYAQGPPPPTHSSPMLNTNTANIQSILGHTQMMQQPMSSYPTVIPYNMIVWSSSRGQVAKEFCFHCQVVSS